MTRDEALMELGRIHERLKAAGVECKAHEAPKIVVVGDDVHTRLTIWPGAGDHELRYILPGSRYPYPRVHAGITAEEIQRLRERPRRSWTPAARNVVKCDDLRMMVAGDVLSFGFDVGGKRHWVGVDLDETVKRLGKAQDERSLLLDDERVGTTRPPIIPTPKPDPLDGLEWFDVDGFARLARCLSDALNFKHVAAIGADGWAVYIHHPSHGPKIMDGGSGGKAECMKALRLLIAEGKVDLEAK